MPSLSEPSPSIINTFGNKDLPPSAYKMHIKLKELLKLLQFQAWSFKKSSKVKEPSKFSKKLYN
jgi:hypothetical protein